MTETSSYYDDGSSHNRTYAARYRYRTHSRAKLYCKLMEFDDTYISYWNLWVG